MKKIGQKLVNADFMLVNNHQMFLNITNHQKAYTMKWNRAGSFQKIRMIRKLLRQKIKVGVKIGFAGLVKAQIDFIFKKVKWGKDSENNTSGDWSSAAASHKNAIALACGKNAKAKGVVGSYIVLTEWNGDADTLLSAKMVRIDGEKYKEDTFYTMQNGEIVEADED